MTFALKAISRGLLERSHQPEGKVGKVKSTKTRVQLRNHRSDVASLEEAKVVESGSLSTASMRTRPTDCGGSVTCMPGSLL